MATERKPVPNGEAAIAMWYDYEQAFGRSGPERGVIESNIGKFVFWSDYGNFPDRNGDEVEAVLRRLGFIKDDTRIFGSDMVGPGAGTNSLRGMFVNGGVYLSREKAEQLTTLAIWLIQKPIEFDAEAYANAAEELAKVKVKL